MPPDFSVSDSLFRHLRSTIPGIPPGDLRAHYAGFAAVSGAAILEVQVKRALKDFCAKKNRIFGVFAESHFDRINGRIRLGNLKEDYISSFGEKYKRRWSKRLEEMEKRNLLSTGRSMKSSYSNLITWRNEFAHTGQPLAYATFEEVAEAYEDSKLVAQVFCGTLSR